MRRTGCKAIYDIENCCASTPAGFGRSMCILQTTGIAAIQPGILLNFIAALQDLTRDVMRIDAIPSQSLDTLKVG